MTEQLPLTQNETEETSMTQQSAYTMMDAVDQSQVMALERGEILEGLVFHFKGWNPVTNEKDKDVFGLTIAGVFDVARNYFQQKQYRFTSTIIDEQFTDKHVRALIRGTLMDKDGIVFISLDRACRIPRFRGKFEDVFADRKAQSIAERNILRRMIPEATVIKTIKEFVKKGKVIYLTPNESFSSLPTVRIKAKQLSIAPIIKADDAEGMATDGQIASIEEAWRHLEFDIDDMWAKLATNQKEPLTPQTLTAKRAGEMLTYYSKMITD